MVTPNPNAIQISWRNVEPRYDDACSYQWRWKRARPTDRSDSRVEAVLGWPKGVIEILRAAFAAGLSRTTGWDLSEIKNAADREAFRAAAKVFRRGVPTSAFGEAMKVSQGAYLVRFVRDQSEVDALIERSDFVIVDHQVENAWPYLEDSRNFHFLQMSEHEKDLSAVARLLSAWNTAGRPRSWLVIGGGLISDIAGFAASLVQCRITVVPTTLLAMIDASVGGKTGVNFPPYGKNQIGSFHSPHAVVVWPGWLQTLSRRSLLSGGAECLKHAILLGRKRLARSVAIALADQDVKVLTEHLPELIAAKADIVARDPMEIGERTALNLGHTLGHALEALSAETSISGIPGIDHGEAVGLGLCFAALLSHRLGYLDELDSIYIWNLVRSAGCLQSRGALQNYLGTSNLSDSGLWPRIAQKLLQDKKQTGLTRTSVNFVLLRAFGRIVNPAKGKYTVAVPLTAIKPAWKDFVNRLV